MAKKFDNYEAFKAEGFQEVANRFGDMVLTRTFKKEVEVAWYGKQESTFTIELSFDENRTICTAEYYKDCFPAFKAKTHVNNKRAYNAIHDTAMYNGFEF